jgi:hypothetical protein
MAPSYELTEQQERVGGWLLRCLTVSTLPAIAVTNLTRSWVFVVAYGAVWVAWCVAMTAWVARTNQMTLAQAFVATLHRSSRSV